MILRKKDLISMNLEGPCSRFCKHFGLLKQTRESRLINPLIVLHISNASLLHDWK